MSFQFVKDTVRKQYNVNHPDKSVIPAGSFRSVFYPVKPLFLSVLYGVYPKTNGVMIV